ncbi:hypothetical protein ABZ702_16220 [Streptomyces cyaneofuscatus]|uniref:hypothetical protein n=1 Tax=Streptomyces cyaneofuscatus TaxID=66883 RepID=UPI003400A2DE
MSNDGGRADEPTSYELRPPAPQAPPGAGGPPAPPPPAHIPAPTVPAPTVPATAPDGAAHRGVGGRPGKSPSDPYCHVRVRMPAKGQAVKDGATIFTEVAGGLKIHDS